MARKTINYKDTLLESLRDSEEAAAYINATLDENSREAFLLALRNIADARGFVNVSRKANLSRESMYRMLSEKGNPKLSSLSSLLDSLGLKFAVEVKE
ncbi:MAG: putative addiction module antidote protein [Nitrospirae bacterium]|nr:putative addiction module antidote protein [Nitrospirota bacterium]MBF0534744.1 putative addiction module antidote protein [Nitrospirota bacterium]MBF0616418.1 putative addiction module antidote protein [Nitrospirota bacterium]